MLLVYLCGVNRGNLLKEFWFDLILVLLQVL